MTTIHISSELAGKLNRLAEHEQKTVDEMAEAILEGQMTLLSLPDKPRPGSGAALLKSALEADIHAGDLVGNSRELLEHEDLSGGATLLKAIHSAKINSGRTDTAERSREILNTEFVEYLLNRMDRDYPNK